VSDFDDELDLEDYEVKRNPVWVPLAIAAAAFAIGTISGGISMALVQEPIIERIEVQRDMTQLELEAACAPLVAASATDLEIAQEKVDDLESQIDAKATELAALEEEMSRREDRGKELYAKYQRAQRELSTLQAQLDDAVAERTELVRVLQETELALEQTSAELETSQEETRIARRDLLSQRWHTFKQRAQLRLCEKGTRKKLEACRKTVYGALGKGVETRFKACVRTGQATPELRRAAKGQTNLPPFGKWLDRDSRALKDWYVVYCDESLPQAQTALAATERKQVEFVDVDDLELLPATEPQPERRPARQKTNENVPPEDFEIEDLTLDLSGLPEEQD